VLTDGLGGTNLAEEATVLISVDDVQEGFEAMDLGVWLVAMPFEVAAHPEDAPSVLGPDEGRFRDWMFHRQLRVLPVRPDLKTFHALPGNPVSDIELRPDIRRRTTPFHEFGKVALAPLALEISQRHGSPRLVTPNEK
jgi:hypothetical protein